MTPDRIQAIAPYIAIGIFVLGVMLLLVSLRYLRKGRTDSYWRARRTAGQLGWRLFLWSLGLMVLSGAICAATGVVALINAHAARNLTITQIVTQAAVQDTQTPNTPQSGSQSRPLPGASPTLLTQTAAATLAATNVPPSSTPSARPTLTPTQPPTQTPTLRVVTATPPPIPTQTPTITETPTETLMPALSITATLNSSVTPGPDAHLTITALDTQISGDFGPISPGVRFTAGFNRIYFFVKYSGMQNGVLWRRQLLYGSTTLDDNLYLWGQQESSGTAYFFFGEEGGFKPGSYEIRLYIGQTDQPATTAIFTVQ